MSSVIDPDPDPQPEPVRERPILKFLGRADVARYLGMRSDNSLAKVQLPPHDAEIGDRRGWFPTTIDLWNSRRPGRGRWGSRVGQARDGSTVVNPERVKKAKKAK